MQETREKMPKLQNRVALVTGGGRGIGKAIGTAFAAEGAKVALAARTRSELQTAVSELRDAGHQAAGFTVDLGDRKALKRLVDDVKAEFGSVDVLVNNAGVGSSGLPRPLTEFDDDFWDFSLAINLTAPYLLIKAVLPDMLAKRWGRVITVASINSRIGSLHGAAYAASKHGVLGLMRTLALEVAPHGVTANCICPGPVKTIMNDRRIAYDARRLNVDIDRYEKSLTPIGGRLDPEDVAPMAVFLASDDSQMITGQAYNVCGGVVMS